MLLATALIACLHSQFDYAFTLLIVMSEHFKSINYYLNKSKIIIIIIFVYLPSDVISQKKTATSSKSITKASKYAIPLKPNT